MWRYVKVNEFVVGISDSENTLKPGVAGGRKIVKIPYSRGRQAGCELLVSLLKSY